MSRYPITVTKTASRHADSDTVFGYDRPLQTFFLQAFPDEEGEDLALWLGTAPMRRFLTSGLRRSRRATILSRCRLVRSGGCSRTAREALRSLPETIIEDVQADDASTGRRSASQNTKPRPGPMPSHLPKCGILAIAPSTPLVTSVIRGVAHAGDFFGDAKADCDCLSLPRGERYLC